MSDLELAAILGGEPPRKRRAAAVAAQKNWQMLSNPDDDDDLIVEQHIIRSAPNVSKVPQNSNIIVTNPVLKRTSFSNNVVILSPDMTRNNNNKKTVVDRDYSPTLDLMKQSHGMKAKKTFATPSPTFRPIIINKTQVIQSANRQVTRPKGPETVLIESETSKRYIVRTDGSVYRKPSLIKLVANEPLDVPTVEGDVEEIIGTYDELLENDNPCDDFIEELSLIMFCESENKKSNETMNESKDSEDIEIIAEVGNSSTQNKTPFRTIQRTAVNRKLRPLNGHFDPIIDTLEMECENFDDEFTDGLQIDCEDDILSETQWKQSLEKRKDFIEYSKSVQSTKNVKFLPEDQVKEEIGKVTTTISETTKVVTIPPVMTRSTRVRLSTPVQSIRAPIPSLVNQSTPLRPQRVTTTVTPRLPTLNQMPITIIPVSSGPGVTNPLIISPPTFVNTTAFGSNVPYILQSGSVGQPTYVMVPRSSVTNAISAQNLIISNGSPVYRSNVINTTTPQSIQLSTVFQRPPQPRAMPSNYIRLPPSTSFTSPSVSSPPVVRIRGTNNAIQLQTYSTIQQQKSATNLNTSQTNSMFDCLTIFKGTPDAPKKITTASVLTIKPLPFSWPSNIDELINSLIKLDNALMKEKFKESPISWMVSANLIVPPKCKTCLTGICNKVSKTLNGKNEFWHCSNTSCNATFSIERPRIFSDARFDMPVSKLLFLIYYWSIQVDVDDLIKTGQIEMGTDKIYNVWARLQRTCSSALQSKDSKLGPVVEICSIQVGKYQVLGAMDVRSHRSKLAVIPITEIVQRSGKQRVWVTFVKWLETGAEVRTCETKFEELKRYGFKISIQSKNAFLSANKNLGLTTISGYLIHHLQRFFKDFDLSSLSEEVLSNILDELLWRERYGTNPFTAFYNIIKHISEQCGLRRPDYDSSVVTLPTGIRTPQNAVKKTVQTYTRPAAPKLDETNSVFVDEYYYSSLTLKKSVEKTTSQEEVVKDSIQCHLCQMFFDNILIVKHLLEHLEKERGGRVRKGDNNDTECKHCLRFFTNRALHMHDELANQKQVPFSCRICQYPLLARQILVGHMKTNHFSGEMPYYCDICGYRSSFQKSLFEHFEASHSNSSQVMCHFCIRIFDLTKFKNLSSFLYRHLTTHYAVASVYDCDKCVSIFTTKVDLKDHCFKGHNPSHAIDEKFEVTPYAVKDEEKLLCTRAKEDELFTPFLPNFGDNHEMASMATETGNDMSFEISCEPNISDFLSIEPEIEINLTDANTSFANFIFPVDCDYSNEKLTHILIKSFDTSLSSGVSNKEEEHIEGVEPNSEPNPSSEPTPEPNPEPNPEEENKNFILSNNQRVVCYECKTHISTDHFMSRMVCEKCNFTTHCKTSFDCHTTGAHLDSTQPHNKQISILRDIPELSSYQNVCKECGFSTTDGNQSALHVINSNHFVFVCKPLETHPEISNDSQSDDRTPVPITDELTPIPSTDDSPLETKQKLSTDSQSEGLTPTPTPTTEDSPMETTD